MIFRKSASFLLLFALLFLLAPHLAHAAGPEFFTVPTGDKSIESWLKPLFGELFGGSSSTFASVAKILNGACMTIGGCFSAYVLVFGTMATAHEGEVLGRKWSSAWVPIRTALGIGLVAPLGGGYCVAQFVVAWAAMQGVGLADNIWQTYTQSYVEKSNMAPTVTLPNVRNLAANVLQSQLCMAAFNRIQKDFPQGSSGEMVATSFSNGRQYGGGGLSADACGSISYNTAQFATVQPGPAGSSIYGAALPAASLTTIQQAHITATAKMEATLGTLAKQIIDARDGGTAPSVTSIFTAIQQYQEDVAAAAKSSVASDDARKAIVESATKDGWLYAGGWFMKAAQLQDATRNAVSAVPVAKPMRSSMGSQDMQIYMAAAQALLVQAGNSTSEKDLDAITGAGNTSNPWMRAFSDFTNSGANSVMSVAQIDNNRDPMMSIKDYGDNIMVASEAAIITGGVVKAGAAAVKAESDSWLGQVGNVVTLGLMSATAGGAASVADMAGTLIIVIGSAMFMFGGSIGVVLPMMPFLLYLATSISWLILVCEAVVAAPLWAVSHNRPGGNDIAGSASSGYMLILSLFLRPPLIVIGFILAMISLQVVIPVFNDVFFTAFRNTNAGSITGVGTMLFMIGIYAGSTISIVYQCFKLTHFIADKVLRWIGGGIEQLGEMAEKMHGDSKVMAVAAGAAATNQLSSISRQGFGGAGAVPKGLGDGKAPTMNAKSAKAPAALQKGQDAASGDKQPSEDQTPSGGGSSSGNGNAGVRVQPATEARSEPASTPGEPEQAGPSRPDNLHDSSED